MALCYLKVDYEKLKMYIIKLIEKKGKGATYIKVKNSYVVNPTITIIIFDENGLSTKGKRHWVSDWI